MEEIIWELVEEVCDFLDIECPAICYDNCTLATETTMAGYSRSNDILYINPNYIVQGYEEIALFSTVHELRHKWQFENKLNFKAYKTSDKLSIKEYNEQFVEIDANAFALLWMDSNYDDWDTDNLIGRTINELTIIRYTDLDKEYDLL